MNKAIKKEAHEMHPQEFAEFVREFVNDHGGQWRPLRGLWPEDVFNFVWSRATLAERKRCAEIARSKSDVGQNSRFYESGTNTTWSSACEAIATAIEKGG